MSYDNTNTGVLFKNDRKETDKHPDYTGQVNVDGVEFWLSAWIKTGQKGKFMSLSVRPKEQRQEQRDTRTHAEMKRPFKDDMDDDIPF